MWISWFIPAGGPLPHPLLQVITCMSQVSKFESHPSSHHFPFVRSTLKSLYKTCQVIAYPGNPSLPWLEFITSCEQCSNPLCHSMKYWSLHREIPFLDSYNPQYMKDSIIPQLIINQQGCLAATATDCQLTVFLLIETQKVENQRHDPSLSHHQGDLGGGTMTVTSHEAQKQDGTMNYPLVNKHSYWTWPYRNSGFAHEKCDFP